MVGTSSNIYVSITGPQQADSEHGYRRPRHTWMLSVEQKPFHVPGTPNKHREPVHYAAAANRETGVYTINTHEIHSDPGIIGNILIAESAHASPEEVHRILKAELAEHAPPAPSIEATSPDIDDEPEQWIRRAIRGLQENKMADWFDVNEFMTFAHGYMANRMDTEADSPALIAYPKIHEDHEKKASKHKFWISHPMSGRTKTNASGEAMVYGGLM